MKHLSRFLWLIPFAVHLGYMAATFRYFPSVVGDASSSLSQFPVFITEWLAIIFLANGTFFFIHLKMPKFNNTLLSVPNKAYWLGSEEKKQILVDKLRSMLETTLLLVNVFFIAVYQLIYQTNVRTPVIQLPLQILIVFFMGFPLVVAIIHMFFVVRSLAKTPANHHPAKD